MSIGDEDLPGLEDKVYTDTPRYKATLKPTCNQFQKEVMRRCHRYFSNKRKFKTAQWPITKCVTYLEEHPVPNNDHFFDDVVWIRERVGIIKRNCQILKESASSSATAQKLASRWHGNGCWLRLYHTLTNDSVRRRFLTAHETLTRAELDARGTTTAHIDFYTAAANLYNDASWIPSSYRLGHIHSDFSEVMELPKTIEDIEPEQVKKKLNDVRAKLLQVKARYNRSGAGDGMPCQHHNEEEDGSTSSCEDKEDYQDGQDWKSFLWHEPTHVLYYWYLSLKFDIHSNVIQQLDDSCLADTGCEDGGSGTSTERQTMSDISSRTNSEKKRKAAEVRSEAMLVETREMTTQMKAFIEISKKAYNQQEEDSKQRLRLSEARMEIAEKSRVDRAKAVNLKVKVAQNKMKLAEHAHELRRLEKRRASVEETIYKMNMDLMRLQMELAKNRDSGSGEEVTSIISEMCSNLRKKIKQKEDELKRLQENLKPNFQQAIPHQEGATPEDDCDDSGVYNGSDVVMLDDKN